jgi:glycosyl transferase family 87
VVIALGIDLVHRHDRTGIDFHTYLAAARVGLHQGWSHIYDQQLVAAEQRSLVPWQWAQPFLSTPPVAWLAAALAWLPYPVAYAAWAALAFGALAAALGWAGLSHGVGRWIAVVGALAPWWVMHAVNVGQVVPLVAACTVVAWRLLRDRHEVAAGLVLAVILLKPNTAVLVPVALVLAGRYRAFAAWAGAAGAVLLLMLLLLGPDGLSAYATQVSGPLPAGADNVTLHGALGVTGMVALALRLVLVVAVMAAAYRLRGPSLLFVPVAIVGSLLISPYLHASDLCLLAVAGWMAWEELPAAAWHIPLAAGWLLASPFAYLGGITPGLNRWPLLELLFLAGLLIAAWLPLTGWADLRRRAPA